MFDLFNDLSMHLAPLRSYLPIPACLNYHWPKRCSYDLFGIYTSNKNKQQRSELDLWPVRDTSSSVE